MATRKENLQTALDRCTAALADLYTNPRPDYSIDGRSYSWSALRKSLLEEQMQLEEALQRADGPFEVINYGE